MTNALKRFVNAPSKPSYLSVASSPRFRFNQSLASSLFLFVYTKNPPKASRTPIIASITPSAKLAIPTSMFPPGTSFWVCTNQTRRRPIRMFFRKSKIPANNPLPGTLSPLIFLSLSFLSTFSNNFSCSPLFTSSCFFLSSFAAFLCVARVLLRT